MHKVYVSSTCSGGGQVCLGEGEGVGGESESEGYQPGPHWQVVAVVTIQAILQTPVGGRGW